MTSRDAILADVRAALGRTASSDAPLPVVPAPVVPASGRIPPRTAGGRWSEVAMLLAEITKLGGTTRALAARDLRTALAELVRDEAVHRAAVWQTPELRALGLEAILASLGVELIPPQAGKLALAGCDLGITGADAALPETGTLVLDAGPARPRMVSLLPRVHLAIFEPAVLVADLSQVFAGGRANADFVFITGPSRTADIELTVTIGVHGPKSLYVWALLGRG